MGKQITQTDREHLQEMLRRLSQGEAVLVSGGFYTDGVPGINEVGPGRRVDTGATVRHLGFGTFKSGDFSFSGGGAMIRSDNFSWTTLSGPTAKVYPFAEAIAAIQRLLR